MRRSLVVIGIALTAVLGVHLAALAANSSAQIVNCSSSTWCYSPNPIQITTGTTVTWTNTTVAPHTATADGGAWTTGTIASGQTSVAVTFNTPGTFTYHCNFHSFMHGSIVVTAAVTTPPASARASAAATTHALAQSGGGPSLLTALLAGALVVLLGLGLLASARLRSGKRASRSRVG